MFCDRRILGRLSLVFVLFCLNLKVVPKLNIFGTFSFALLFYVYNITQAGHNSVTKWTLTLTFFGSILNIGVIQKGMASAFSFHTKK